MGTDRRSRCAATRGARTVRRGRASCVHRVVAAVWLLTFLGACGVERRGEAEGTRVGDTTTTETTDTLLFSDLTDARGDGPPAVQDLVVQLDPAGRPYDEPLPPGATLTVRSVGPVHLPGGDLAINPGESLLWGQPEARTIGLGEDEDYDVDAVLMAEGTSGEYRSVAGLVFHVSAEPVDRWSAFEVGYGTDGGMGATTSVAFGPAHDDLPFGDVEALSTTWIDRLSTEGGIAVEDADGVPGAETILFANGFGDGVFPMARAFDREGRLARLVIWNAVAPWRLVFGDHPVPPDVADREEEIAACLAGKRVVTGYTGCVVRSEP